MPRCVFDLLEEMARLTSDIEQALEECQAEEPLSVRFCIAEVRAAILDLTKLMRAYEREEEDSDDAGQ